MKSMYGIALIVVVAFFGLNWYLGYIANPPADSEEIRTKLVTELEAFSGFQEHREMFMEVIDWEHQDTFDRVEFASRKGFNWESYRSDMYRALTKALQDAGDEDAVIKLDRFRAGG